jgi:formylmethanofuran dehydrogenase subunit E
MASTLTEAQLKQLADRLIDTGSNVYRLSESMFNHKFTDKDWDELKEKTKIFKCEECNQWKSLDEHSGESDICKDCMDEI